MYKVLVVLLNFTFPDLRELLVIVLQVTKRTYRPMKINEVRLRKRPNNIIKLEI